MVLAAAVAFLAGAALAGAEVFLGAAAFLEVAVADCQHVMRKAWK